MLSTWTSLKILSSVTGLTHNYTMPHFEALKIHIAVENIVRKGEIACNKQFLLFSQCFLPYMVLIFHLKCTLTCRLHLVSIWTSLKCCQCENIVRKGEIACNKQFLLFSQCFLPYMVLIFHLKCTLTCRLHLVSIWTSLKFCRLLQG